MQFIRPIGIGLFFFLFPCIVFAYQPIVESKSLPLTDNTSLTRYALSQPIGDPTTAAIGLFGSLSVEDEIDLYAFSPRQEATIPIEIAVPANKRLPGYFPTVAILSVSTGFRAGSKPYPLKVPIGMGIMVIDPPPETSLATNFEALSMQKVESGTITNVEVHAGELYFLALYDPNGRKGRYIIKLGDTMGSDNASDFAPNVLLFPLKFEGESEENIPDQFDPNATRYLKSASNEYKGYNAIDGKIRLIFSYFGFILYRFDQILQGMG